MQKCSRNTKSLPEAVMGKQSQPRGAQVYAMYLRDQKGDDGARIHPFQTSFKVGSGGRGILLEIPVCLRYSKGKQIFFFPLFLCQWLLYLGLSLLQLRTLLPCYHCCALRCILMLQTSNRINAWGLGGGSWSVATIPA